MEPELKAICYVGLENKFVMVTRFPDEEYFPGLQYMLDDWLGEDDVFYENLLDQGFYELNFEIEQDINYNPEYMTDAYLVLKTFKRISVNEIPHLQ